MDQHQTSPDPSETLDSGHEEAVDEAVSRVLRDEVASDVDDWGEIEEEPRVKPPRWVLPALVLPILAMIVANNVGAVLLTSSLRPSGLVESPLRILALNSTNKVLLATGNQTAFWWFLFLATVRLLAPDGFFYGIGILYRHQALRWGRRVFPGSDPLFDLFEREDHAGVRRLLDGLVLIMPNNPVCLLAGVAAMPLRRFWTINVVGTVGRVLLFLWLSHLFRDQIRSVMNLVATYQKWALGITIVVVVIALFTQARRVVVSTEALAEGED